MTELRLSSADSRFVEPPGMWGSVSSAATATARPKR